MNLFSQFPDQKRSGSDPAEFHPVENRSCHRSRELFNERVFGRATSSDIARDSQPALFRRLRISDTRARPSFTQYSSTTVLGNTAVVAYWPLLEANDSLPAADLTPNPDNGQYIDPSTLPAIYNPWPDYSIANPPGPNILSAAPPG